MQAVMLEEVKELVKGMEKNKAPEPDGYTGEFYQGAWKFIWPDILNVVEESCQNQKVYPSLNATFISLIPKSSKSDDPRGFRPIASYNVIYKIISMVIIKRLKPLLPLLISPQQKGFNEGRKILYGFVASEEIMHSHKSQKLPHMMIKLDVWKAYDRFRWEYLGQVLGAFRFDERWIKWIQALVSSPVFSILLYGSPSQNPNQGQSGKGSRNHNYFEILQEDEESAKTLMAMTDLETQSQIQRGGSNSKRKAEEEPHEKEVTM